MKASAKAGSVIGGNATNGSAGIASTAAPGFYPMVMSNAEGSGLTLGNIHMYGWNGSITVRGPTPSPTP